jgi:hypothetical protein
MYIAGSKYPIRGSDDLMEKKEYTDIIIVKIVMTSQ